MLKTNIFVSVCIIYVASISQGVTGECCRESVHILYQCNHVHKPLCDEVICMDGTLRPNFLYCAHRSCNIFGCNCDGGCRTGTAESAVASFKHMYHSDVVSYYLI